MFYMPGIDGTGLAAYRQFPRLTRAFDLRCLIIPGTDRSTFEELTNYVAVSTEAQQPTVTTSLTADCVLQMLVGSRHSSRNWYRPVQYACAQSALVFASTPCPGRESA